MTLAPTAGASLPLILGWDVSGVIEEVGSEAEGRPVGQRVVATLAQGGYAELVSVNVAGTVPMPDSLSYDEAASMPIAFLTSWYALLKVAELQAGETVLIQAGGSGIGMAAIQLAKYVGAKVITTASTSEKLEKARNLGADHTINYREQDFLAEVRRMTDQAGVNVVLESVGGDVMSKSVEALALLGRLVTVGNTSRTPSTIDPGLLTQRTLKVMGFSLSSQMGRGGVMPELARIMELFGEGKLTSVVDRVFPLSEAAEAHRYVAQARNFGKVILHP